jgi:TPR repeat protein
MKKRSTLGLVVVSLGLLTSVSAAFADAASDVTACEMLAASPLDKERPANVPGVAVADMNADAAVAACKTALASNPQNLRIMYDLARAFNKTGKEPEQMFQLYLKSSASGNPVALNNLANSYIEGLGTAKDEAKGYQLRCDAAARGLAIAMSFCGDNYRFGQIKNDNSDDENQKIGFGWYQKAADAGDARGTFKLGSAYFYGRGVTEDKAKGNVILQKAADLGSSDAAVDLGANYLDGDGVPKSSEKGIALYLEAAKQNNVIALNNLGNTYIDGENAPKNPTLAKDYFEKGIALGNPASMNDLGYRLFEGDGFPKDVERGLKLVKQAADNGNRFAYYNLGRYNEGGIGMTKDVGAAIAFYVKAAEQNHTTSMMRLGAIAEDGLWKEEPKKNKTTALRWYAEAAVRGEDDARKKILAFAKQKVALPENDDITAARYYQILTDAGDANGTNELGLLYEDGKGVEQNWETALGLYRKAADAKNIYAMNNLGLMYEKGRGVLKRPEEAFKWYKLASDGGNADATNNLALLYEIGSGVKTDMKKAVSLYEKAAKGGNTTAMANLGKIYSSGNGVPKDLAKAVKWFQKGIAAKGADSMTELGYLYAIGEGVPKDLTKANALFKDGAEAGDLLGMNNYGYNLMVGDGVKLDETIGLAYLLKAIDGGGSQAPTSLAEIIEAGEHHVYKAEDVARYYLLGLQRGDENARIALIEKQGRELKPDTIAAIHAQLKAEGKSFEVLNMGFAPTVIEVLKNYSQQ